jgi:triacylglycerol lipase
LVPKAKWAANHFPKMYLPPDFTKYDAIACGQLIDQAYEQYRQAIAAAPAPVPWSIQDGYTNCGSFSAVEKGQVLPFGFVASKDQRLFVVIRGTQTPLEWLDDASIQPMPFITGWGSTTAGFLRLHNQIYPTIEKLVLDNQGNTDQFFVTGHSLGAALANLAAAQLIGNKSVTPDRLIVYTFSGPRVGNPIFADQFNKNISRAWRVFNTEDLVPTLPLSTVDADPRSSLGLFETNVELVLKLFFKPSPFVFQHVDTPVALTYQLNSVADNHNLTQLYSRLN